MFSAMGELEKTLYGVGYDDGFNAGWDAAWRRFSALTQTAPRPEPTEQTVGQPPELPKAFQESELPTMTVVLEIVKSKPGLRGIEIIDAAKVAGTPLKERTVRTALHRLKENESIRNLDGRWFVAASDASESKAA